MCSDLAKEWDPENATIVSVDVASPKMFPPESADLVDKISLRIDHHGSGTPFAPEELVDPTAAACAATGAKLQPINQALFDTVSLNKLKVQAGVTTHTQFFCDGQHAAAGGRGDAETGRLCLRVPH